MTLTRCRFTPNGIFGELTNDQGQHLAYTLEHSYNNIPKIPVGSYTCKRRLSPHFGYDVFELIDVPGHDFIEIHIGNYNADSNGCILLGAGTNEDEITSSRTAFNAFMASLTGVDTFILTIK